MINAINYHYAFDMLTFKELNSPAELDEIEQGFASLTRGVVRGCVGKLSVKIG